MPDNESFARTVRLHRLYRHSRAHLFVVPLDHSVTDGPPVPGAHPNDLLRQVCDNGVDAVVLHKGRLRHIRPYWFGGTALVLHLSASTSLAPDPDAKGLVTGVEEAIRLGADCVSVHVNLGSADERRQLGDLGAVADACDRWNLPLLAMVYPRGPKVANPHDPTLVALATTVAADLGADLVKTVCPRPVESLADITRGCPIPVLVAGGPARGDADELVNRVQRAMRSGAGGIAVGRHIFSAADPGAITRKLADAVHGGYEPVGDRS